jgi:hypothetical protein
MVNGHWFIYIVVIAAFGFIAFSPESIERSASRRDGSGALFHRFWT